MALMSAAPSTATPLSPSGSAHFTIGLAPADLVHTVVTVSLA